MLGTQRYKLPGAKRKQAPAQPQEPVESGEEQSFQDGPQEDDYAPAPTFAPEDSYKNDDSHKVTVDTSDEYYFEAQEEPEKPALFVDVKIESNRNDIATFEDIEHAAQTIVQEGDKDEAPKKAAGFNERDTSLPFVSPPGYVWVDSTGSKVPFWSVERILNFVGIGDSAERFRTRPEVVEEEEPQILSLMTSPGQDSDNARRQYIQKQQLEKNYEKLQEEAAKEKGEMPEEANFNVDDLVSVEPSEGPRGWMFWHGDRWNHWWHGYDSPSSITGYPVQWFYRTVHLFFPETYDSFKYERDYGEIDLRSIPQGAWWVVTHPCGYQIILNCALVAPFALIPQLLKRYRQINAKIRSRRTVLEKVSDFLPVIWRRLSYKKYRRRRNRYMRWVAFFTFAFAPNCWDLIGHHIENPTDDYWEKNYIHRFTDGIQTSSSELAALEAQKPRTMQDSIWTAPNVAALQKYQEEMEIGKKKRLEHRKEVFGSEKELRDAWQVLQQEETSLRQQQIERANAALELRKSASSPKL